MKILILRTFAHYQIWEEIHDNCEFEVSQLNSMIYSWEPNYTDFEIDNFKYAIGIYTNQYFTHETQYFQNLVFQGTVNEQIISLLKLNSFKGTSKFLNVTGEGTLKIYYSFVRKLWTKRDRPLMNKIDSMLIEYKKNELKTLYGKIPTTTRNFIPLSFSLEEKLVENIFSQNKLEGNFDF